MKFKVKDKLPKDEKYAAIKRDIRLESRRVFSVRIPFSIKIAKTRVKFST